MQTKLRPTAVVGLPDDRDRTAQPPDPRVVRLGSRPAETATVTAAAAATHPVFGQSCADGGQELHTEERAPLRLVHDAAAAGGMERPGFDGEDGSLVTEYGLLAIVAATVAGAVIQWASGGAIVRLFNALLNAARDLVGAG